FMSNNILLKIESAVNSGLPMLDVLNSEEFSDVHSSLLKIWSDCIEVYTDEFLKSAGSTNMTSEAAAYFLAVDVVTGGFWFLFCNVVGTCLL
ncbi:hypothetical protein G9A89_017739, partial [Geosiphon pyriformis]